MLTSGDFNNSILNRSVPLPEYFSSGSRNDSAGS